MTKHMDRDMEHNDGNINAKDFLIGALVGGIVGAATALFLAPKSGKEMRSDLNIQAQALKEKTGQFAETAKVKGVELVETAKEKSTTIGQTVSKQSSEIINKVKSLKPSKGAVEQTEEEGLTEESNFDASANAEDIQRKLEETKKAFDETESLLNR